MQLLDADLLSRITIEEGKMGGRPCIRGMRIRVADVLDLLANGLSPAEIVDEMPDLELPDIFAALRYASIQSGSTVVIKA